MESNNKHLAIYSSKGSANTFSLSVYIWHHYGICGILSYKKAKFQFYVNISCWIKKNCSRLFLF